jgi:hypothetical protein
MAEGLEGWEGCDGWEGGEKWGKCVRERGEMGGE